MFSSTAPILRRSNPEGRGRRRMGPGWMMARYHHVRMNTWLRALRANVHTNGQRHGFKARTIRTSTGQMTPDVPQVRNSQTPLIPIIPGFERGSRMDRSLNLAIAELYLQGVSTRKVAKVMNEICGGNGVSATEVSQCCAQLDTLFGKWRNRPIPPMLFSSSPLKLLGSEW